MNCPFCAGELESYAVGAESARTDAPYRRSQALSGGRELDRCRSCEGIWFDAGEMAAGLRDISAGHCPPKRTAKASAPLLLANAAHRPCPRCDGHLNAIRSGVAPAVTYWRCEGCRGVWIKTIDLTHFASPQVALVALAANEFR